MSGKLGCVTECEVSWRVPVKPSFIQGLTNIVTMENLVPQRSKSGLTWSPFPQLGSPLLPAQAERHFSSPPAVPAAARERELPGGRAASPPRAVTLCWRAPRTSIPAGWLPPLHREDGAAPSPPRLGYVRVVRATVHGSISCFPFCAAC